VIAGLAGLAYEVIGGRTLGTEGFAPVSALLTLHFLAFVVVLIPLEQVTIRRLTLDALRPGIPVGALSVILTTAIAVGLAGWTLRGQLFNGDGAFAILVAATILTHGLFVLARGYLAGRSRFRSYGMASGAAAVFRLAIAGVVVAVTTEAVWFGLALVLGPLVVLAWRAFSSSVDEAAAAGSSVVDTASSEGRYVAGLMLASAASQAMLLAGPIAAALLGATAAVVSIVFVTFSVARAPLSLGYNLIARIVPPLTRLAAAGDHRRLTRLARQIGLATTVVGLIGYLLAVWVGPPVISFLFGSEFRPTATFTGLVGAGVIVAAGSLAVGQIFVARGDTHRLADAWLVAMAAAALSLLIPVDDPATRVALAFVAGEVVALVSLMAAAAKLPPGRSDATAGTRPGYQMAKRTFDLVVASVLAIALLPVIVVVAVAVVTRSGRPALFAQPRVGQHGKQFRLWKFRTMDVDGDPAVFGHHLDELRGHGADEGVDLHIHNDPRVTKVGGFLRRWSLDELPNLWNVIRGDLSLVGPRPLLAEEVAVIANELGEEATRQRAQVRPGITGLAQVEGRDDISLAARSAHDMRYLDQRSLSVDLWILMRTAVSVFRHRGI
ncbi:MAG: hypothetical protein HKN91_03095, partial [Acidimicrobiia bacterium]|nr:hypothetical protein [Acidimicrobiia bacterium]